MINVIRLLTAFNFPDEPLPRVKPHTPDLVTFLFLRAYHLYHLVNTGHHLLAIDPEIKQ